MNWDEIYDWFKELPCLFKHDWSDWGPHFTNGRLQLRFCRRCGRAEERR